jgi:hypothetical protein
MCITLTHRGGRARRCWTSLPTRDRWPTSLTRGPSGGGLHWAKRSHRLIFPLNTILDLDNVPEEQWDPFQNLVVIYALLPNIVLSVAHATVHDEDYRLVEGLQANLESGARDQQVFGRNEPGLHHRHITWEQALTPPETTQ